MAFNGSGTFTLYSPGNPVVTGTTISSTWANNTLTDIATGLSTCLTKDGQTTPTANIPMGSNRLTGLGAATARTDAIQYAQVQDGSPQYLTGVAGTNTITATAPNSMSAYATGQFFRFTPANTITGAATLNINSIGAKNVYANNAACIGGEIKANIPCTVQYDGTQFQIVSSALQGWTLIQTQSASNSATVDFTSGLSSAFDLYVITLTDVIPATDNVTFTIRVSQSSTFRSGASDYAYAQGGFTSGGVTVNNGSTGGNGIFFASGVSNASTSRNFAGVVEIYNPAGTSLTKVINYRAGYSLNGGVYASVMGHGQYTGATSGSATSAIDGIRFLMSSGNITSGVFTLYGVRKS